MATITSESRFGPNFSTGREEEPGPFESHTSSCFNTSKSGDRHNKNTSTKGSFPLAARVNPLIENKKIMMGGSSPGPLQYQPKLEGEFPKVFTTEDINLHKSMIRPVRDRRPAKQPTIYGNEKYPMGTLKISAGPGCYNIDKDTNQVKISTNSSFGNEKRVNMLEFMQKVRNTNDNPGPASYFPTNNQISSEIDKTHDLRGMIARAKRNDDLLENAFKSLKMPSNLSSLTPFRKLSNSLSSPTMKASLQRFNKAKDYDHNGPGSYKHGTDFDFTDEARNKSTFGRAKRTDLLTSLQNAGHVGPGAYDPPKDYFILNTKNTRCGFKSTSKTISTNIRTIEDNCQDSTDSKVSGEELWKKLMYSRKEPLFQDDYCVQEHQKSIEKAKPKGHERKKKVYTKKRIQFSSKGKRAVNKKKEKNKAKKTENVAENILLPDSIDKNILVLQSTADGKRRKKSAITISLDGIKSLNSCFRDINDEDSQKIDRSITPGTPSKAICKRPKPYTPKK